MLICPHDLFSEKIGNNRVVESIIGKFKKDNGQREKKYNAARSN